MGYGGLYSDILGAKLAFIPTPAIRTATFRGVINATLNVVASGVVNNIYLQDIPYGYVSTGILDSFNSAINGDKKIARGINNGTSASVTGLGLDFYTLANNGSIAHNSGDAFINAPAGIFDGQLYVSYVFEHDSSQSMYTLFKFWNVDLTLASYDPSMGGLISTDFVSVFPTVIAGETRLNGSLLGGRRLKPSVVSNLRIGSPYRSEKTSGVGPWTAYHYYFCFENLSVGMSNGFKLTFDSSIDFANTESIDTTDNVNNYSLILNNNPSSRILVRWKETSYSWEGGTDQDNYIPQLSDGSDQADWAAFGYGQWPIASNFWGFVIAVKNGFLISYSNWSTGYYRFFLVDAAWQNYWRINWQNMPGGYDGIASMFLDDQGNFSVSDDYHNIYVGLGFIPTPPVSTNEPAPVFAIVELGGNPVSLRMTY